MQSKAQSLIEVVCDVGSGVLITILIQILLFPALGIPISRGNGLIILLVFTLLSLIKKYLWRRYFNSLFTKSD